MDYDNILVETNGLVATITLNRPKTLNALSAGMIGELGAALGELERDKSVHVVILTGTGKAFSCGADIKEIYEKGWMDVYFEDFITKTWSPIFAFRKPIIAAVSGYAMGGGCEIAMGCDFIIASETAKFALPEVMLGTIPAAAGTQRLTRAVGKSKAMEMCLTGRFMEAEEAERLGLVSRVVAQDKLIEEALKSASRIAEMSLPAIMMAKECVNRAFETTLAEGTLFERRTFHSTFALNDIKEGMTAFVEKRPPRFMNS
jgi:enoyl-CoA hydratase